MRLSGASPCDPSSQPSRAPRVLAMAPGAPTVVISAPISEASCQAACMQAIARRRVHPLRGPNADAPAFRARKGQNSRAPAHESLQTQADSVTGCGRGSYKSLPVCNVFPLHLGLSRTAAWRRIFYLPLFRFLSLRFLNSYRFRICAGGRDKSETIASILIEQGFARTRLQTFSVCLRIMTAP